MTKKEVDRQDRLARAMAAIVGVRDLFPGDLPAALHEAIDKGAEALSARDDVFQRTLLVVGATAAEAADWAARNSVDGGSQCVAMTGPRDLRAYAPPLTIVVLPGADSTDEWPRTWAQIAALGGLADVIRLDRRPPADLRALGQTARG